MKGRLGRKNQEIIINTLLNTVIFRNKNNKVRHYVTVGLTVLRKRLENTVTWWITVVH